MLAPCGYRVIKSPLWGMVRRKHLDFPAIEMSLSLLASHYLECELDGIYTCLSSLCGNLDVDVSGARVSWDTESMWSSLLVREPRSVLIHMVINNRNMEPRCVHPKRCKTSSVGQSAGLLILRSSVRFRQKLKKLRTQIYMDLRYIDPQTRVLNYF